mmetsp:Transcript_3841/g.5845  ORF Transcript_3841/g.5845 Transcript_3841/m.5845 type:complete len:312 (-) Transcript_3841:307-1242(-)
MHVHLMFRRSQRLTAERMAAELQKNSKLRVQKCTLFVTDTSVADFSKFTQEPAQVGTMLYFLQNAARNQPWSSSQEHTMNALALFRLFTWTKAATAVGPSPGNVLLLQLHCWRPGSSSFESAFRSTLSEVEDSFGHNLDNAPGDAWAPNMLKLRCGLQATVLDSRSVQALYTTWAVRLQNHPFSGLAQHLLRQRGQPLGLRDRLTNYGTRYHLKPPEGERASLFHQMAVMTLWETKTPDDRYIARDRVENEDLNFQVRARTMAGQLMAAAEVETDGQTNQFLDLPYGTDASNAETERWRMFVDVLATCNAT